LPCFTSGIRLPEVGNGIGEIHFNLAAVKNAPPADSLAGRS
jgi:hypothetical protein